MNRNLIKVISVAFAVQAGVAAAQSAPTPDRGVRLVEAVTDCVGIADPTSRLACYDKASAALVAAQRRRDITVLSREEVTEKRRSLFGLPVDDRKLFGGGADVAPIETLEAKVTRVTVAGRAMFTVTLADNTVWRTTEPMRDEPVVGDDARIRRGTLGGYFGTFNRGRGVRIERVR